MATRLTKAVEEPNESSPSNVVTDGFDVLRYINFVWEKVTPEELTGRFLVTARSSQPFGVLHGGVTAYIAEALASMGAQLASKARVAGVDLIVTHLLAVPIGGEVFVKATPLRVGKRVQVWDVKFSIPVKKDASNTEPQEFTTSAVARLTLIVGLPDPKERAEGNNEELRLIVKEKNVQLASVLSKL